MTNAETSALNLQLIYKKASHFVCVILHFFRKKGIISIMKKSERKKYVLVESGDCLPVEGILFRKLLKSSEFLEFATILKRLTGLSMALNTPDVGSTYIGVEGDKGNPVCKLIRGTKEGLRCCGKCDQRFQRIAGVEKKSKLYTCHAGFYDLAVPIIVQGKHVATISTGQVLAEKHSEEGFKKLQERLKGLGISETRLRKAYNSALWLSRKDLKSVMRLVEVFARQICDSALRIHELNAQLERPEIRQAKEYVENHFRDSDLQLTEVAEHVGVSKAHFSHRFHQETGLTFTQYVQSRRTNEAKRMLKESKASITEICYRCGFSSLTHFNRVFRKVEDCSPSQYRGKNV